jgi:hypothetical protein
MKKLLLTGIAALFLANTALQPAVANPVEDLYDDIFAIEEMFAYISICDGKRFTTAAQEALLRGEKEFPKKKQTAARDWVYRTYNDGNGKISKLCDDPKVKGNVQLFNAAFDAFYRAEPTPAPTEQEQLLRLEQLRLLAEKRRLEAERNAIERQEERARAAQRQQQERARLCYEEPINCPPDYWYWYSYRTYRR